jgi:CDP-2,3-bis-(O-geranylgeranyl)-sn-glycerol synthase
MAIAEFWVREIARFAWLAAPVVVAALVHLAVLRLGWLESLRIPLDGGATFRGRRVLGDNKTLRGAVIMIAVSSATMVLQGIYRVPSLEYFDYGSVNLALAGMLLGVGFVLGELPNSFLKRQLGVAPGARGGMWHAMLDQLDSVIGALLLLSLLWVAPLRVWIIGFALGAGLHIAVNGVFVLVGVKRTIF